MKPVWAWFGYDEPNYTYMKDGQKLLTELSKLSPVPVFVRTHNLLTTGDGTPGLKWGSTNAYTEDANGKPIYDWTIVDRIVDTYLKRGMKPMMQIGFMPEAMSVKPQPYRHDWQPGVPYNRIYTGWAHPPKDYAKWGELVYQWARHSVQKYGRAEVESWVLGSLERARHRLLAEHARGVLQAVRLRRRRPQARAADRAHRRAGGHRSERRAHAEVPARLHRALPARHQPRDREGRLAARLRHVPRQGRAARHQGERHAVRADVGQQPAPRHRQRLLDRRVVSGAEGHADRHRRIRSRRLRRVPGEDRPAQRLSQRHDVLELHRRADRPDLRAGRPAQGQPARLGDVGVRVRGSAVLLRLPRPRRPTACRSRC